MRHSPLSSPLEPQLMRQFAECMARILCQILSSFLSMRNRSPLKPVMVVMASRRSPPKPCTRRASWRSTNEASRRVRVSPSLKLLKPQRVHRKRNRQKICQKLSTRIYFQNSIAFERIYMTCPSSEMPRKRRARSSGTLSRHLEYRISA